MKNNTEIIVERYSSRVKDLIQDESNEFTPEQILECHYDFRKDLDNHFEQIRKKIAFKNSFKTNTISDEKI